MTEQTQIERLQAEILAIKRAAATGAWCRRNHSDNKPVFSDYDALVARLLKFCKVADSCPECAIDRAEAATAIRELRAEVKQLESLAGHWAERSTHWQDRAERAEADRDALLGLLRDIQKWLRAGSDPKVYVGSRLGYAIDAALAKGEGK